jgi:hypothetical protein
MSVDLFDTFNKETFFSDLEFTFTDSGKKLFAHITILESRLPGLLTDLCEEAGISPEVIKSVIFNFF